MKFKVIIFTFVILSSESFAEGFDRCNYNFYNKTPPVIIKSYLAKNNYDLCYSVVGQNNHLLNKIVVT